MLDTLRAYPGESKTIQLITIQNQPQVIPAGATFSGALVGSLQQAIALLTPSIINATTGMIKVVVPDSALVRRNQGKRLRYDLIMTNSLGLSKSFGLAECEILYSPTQYSQGATIPIPTPTPVPGATPSPAPGATNVVKLFVKDMVWQGLNGKLYQEELVVGADGVGAPRYTEITVP